MNLVDNLLVSDQIFTQCFCCDMDHCGGICCVEGDSGAPLEESECTLLASQWETYKPYMQPSGVEAIAQQGAWVRDRDGDKVTPLIAGKECAYAFFDANGHCKCAIEKAYEEGKSTFRKPISCWLYPIRVQRLTGGGIALNYHEWDVCHKAVEKGNALHLTVAQFLKEPLTALLGESTYQELLRSGQQV